MKNLRKQRKNVAIKCVRTIQDAIKQYCYDCMGGQKKIDCQLTKCPLYPHRPWSKNGV